MTQELPVDVFALGLKQDAMVVSAAVVLYHWQSQRDWRLQVVTLGQADLNRLPQGQALKCVWDPNSFAVHFSGQPGCSSAWALGNSGMKYHGHNAVLR